MSKETTPGGSDIIRHEERVYEELELAHGIEQNIEIIDAHIEKHLGVVDNVYHELMSDIVHIDIHTIAPTPERDYYTLVTSGMSDLPMAAPNEFHERRFGELYINLPKTWKLSTDDFEDESNYWPIRWLKYLARLPHEYASWLSYGHSVPNGDPAEPIADTKFSGVVLLSSMDEFTDFEILEVSPEKQIWFYNVVPLYPEEMDMKLNKGTDKIEDLLMKRGMSGPIDTKRVNVAKKWWQR